MPHVARSRQMLAPQTVRITPTEAPPPAPDAILQLGMAFWGSKTLLSAIELEVFTQLAREPGTCEELQRRIGLHARSARDFLDTLVALNLLQRTGRVYMNTPAAALFLDKAKPSYIGGILEMANDRLYRFWGNLTQALRTGQPQNEASSGELPLFDALYAEPARLRQFLGAMTGVSRGANLAIASDFPWSKYRTFVDVGTAQGDLAVQVARAHAHLTGVGFDLPAATAIFTEYAEQNGVADRVKFVAGDFFRMPLPKADVIMMGHILHDWNADQKRQLVRAAFEALPKGGAFIVYDAIIDDERKENAFGLLMSLNMLIETPGGFDYTGADAIGWMKEAGFTEAYVQHLVGPDSMIVGVK
jgi:ubiquinone/menaquinone biosynthesis C-methylase UbiE